MDKRLTSRQFYRGLNNRAVTRALREYSHPGWKRLVQDVEGNDR